MTDVIGRCVWECHLKFRVSTKLHISIYCTVGFADGDLAIEAEEASAFAESESVLQWNCPVDYLAVSQGKK